MEGKIDNHGMLHITRGMRTEMQQYCPAGGNNENRQYAECGDWCPLFGEPTISTDESITQITICQGRNLIFEKFTDERNYHG